MKNEIKLGLCVMYPSPGSLERIGRDWDWIWLDGQHGQLAGYDQMLSMVRACHFIGRPAFVRVPGHDPAWISLALDMGAEAVIVPQVDTVEEAAPLVAAAKFPGLGNRSYGGRRVIDLHGRTYHEKANGDSKLICQIESPQGVKNAAAIAALPGVDGLFFGPDDFRLRSGGNMAQTGKCDEQTAAIQIVADACRAASKDCICVGIGAEMTAHCASLGVNYIVAGGDVAFLANGSALAAKASREALANLPQETEANNGKSSVSAIY